MKGWRQKKEGWWENGCIGGKKGTLQPKRENGRVRDKKELLMAKSKYW